MLFVDPVEFRVALQARNRAVAFHLFDPNVSLVDVGLRIKEREGGQITDQLTVRVHLRYKPRGEAFEAFTIHSPERVIDEDLIGFPVDIVEANYRLQQWFWPSTQPPVRGRVYNPLQGGISISNEWSFGYGTLGGIVEDRNTRDKMILSNWHVLAGSAYVPKGLRIYQPGYGDGGRFQNTVAYLDRHAMNDGIDAAVATLANVRPSINDQLDVGPVSGIVLPILDMHVMKSGRTTEVTEGIITGVEGVRTIPYGGLARVVRHIVHIAQTPERGEISAPGDSGSWWLEKSTKKVMGLHFAGNNDPEYGLAIDMGRVLDALNVDIVTGSEDVVSTRIASARWMEPVRV